MADPPNPRQVPAPSPARPMPGGRAYHPALWRLCSEAGSRRRPAWKAGRRSRWSRARARGSAGRRPSPSWRGAMPSSWPAGAASPRRDRRGWPAPIASGRWSCPPTWATRTRSAPLRGDGAGLRPARPAVQQRRHRRPGRAARRPDGRAVAAGRRRQPDRRLPLHAGRLPPDEGAGPAGAAGSSTTARSRPTPRGRTPPPTRRPSTPSPA